MNLLVENFTLKGEEPARLAAVIDSSLRVSSEEQFFSWVQCEVQYLLSHEILVCGITSGADSKMRCYRFSSTRYFKPEHFNAMCEPIDGLFSEMMGFSRKTGKPFVLGPEVSIGGGDKAWLPLLEKYELRNAAAHGLRGPDGQLKSYFCFSRITEELSSRITYVIEVLTPILDATLSRVVAYQGVKPRSDYPTVMPLSRREIEILHFLLVGKTNKMIAQELTLSPLTVKNHVQNVMKKLKVNTRGHAVSKGIKLGLLISSGEAT